MITIKDLQLVLPELKAASKIGCIYDIKERFGISLNVLEVLGFTKKIKRKIPKCDEHCKRHCDCPWLPLYSKRKSKSKFLLTEMGDRLADECNATQDTALITRLVRDELQSTTIVDSILVALMDASAGLSTEVLVSSLLTDSSLSLEIIRTTLADTLALLENIDLLSRKEGLLFPV